MWPADHDRQRALDGPGMGVHALEVDVLAVVSGGIVLPEAAHRGEVLVGARPRARIGTPIAVISGSR